ncbi:hypothetical protein [Marinisporobacter balticus]|uniref:CARD domain-containing protein n=1 Tax=Marinisporobacter balticus TaxID=2018667 RepID=A0A4R2KNU7_9FIRM|nr:hypothetical protein [Marinisporobacter balticus]TCO68255.1 hypothetical protein EV214_1477 [Marinisporobacter balticus]
MKSKKIMNGILVGIMVFSMAGMAFADNLNSKQQIPKTKGVMQNRDQANTEKRKVNVQEQINQLVKDGVITQEQATKWQAFNEEKKTERKTEMEKVKAMTAEERKGNVEEMKNNREDRGNGLEALVKLGIFSQEIADEVAQKMHDMRAVEQEEKFKEHTKKLVEDGIITQSEATKWEEFNEEKKAERKLEMEKVKAMTTEERKLEMEKVKAMTTEERKANFEEKKNNKGEKGDRLAELVKAGVISQDTADKMKSEAQQRPKKPERHERPKKTENE